jgi:hypothetical protein
LKTQLVGHQRLRLGLLGESGSGQRLAVVPDWRWAAWSMWRLCKRARES